MKCQRQRRGRAEGVTDRVGSKAGIEDGCGRMDSVMMQTEREGSKVGEPGRQDSSCCRSLVGGGTDLSSVVLKGGDERKSE